MKLKSDRGFAHVVAVAILGFAVLALAGAAGYSVKQANRSANNSQALLTYEQAETNLPDAQPTVEKVAETEPVVEEPVAPTPSNTTSTRQATQPSTDTNQPRTIQFTKGGGDQQGDVVSVSSNLSESQSGTCTYTFSLNGTVRVQKTNVINGSKVCSISIPVSDFPKSATYSFTLSFASNDGLVTANQSAFDITVQ